MNQKKQMRFSDEELSLIQNTFTDEESLKELRKHFLGVKSSDRFKTKDVMAVLRKTFLPEIEADAPIHQVIDLWLTLNVKQMPAEEAYPLIKAREILVNYFTDRLKELEGGKGKTKFSDYSKISDDREETFINLIARNEIITHIEQQLSQLNVLANNSAEDLLKAIEQDSTK